MDSPCTIQDDTGDWQREVSKMAHVFKNCTLMVSATSSENSEHEALKDRDPRLKAVEMPVCGSIRELVLCRIVYCLVVLFASPSGKHFRNVTQ
ncbi:hypothetical protein B0J14DRAFT_66021 [Halenospora varia]|nr:hypothetical protein B0J14DRAFT_66021 [Halenospora varia]